MGKLSKSSKSKKKKTVTASFHGSKKTPKSRVASKFHTKMGASQRNKTNSRSSKKVSKHCNKSAKKSSSIKSKDPSGTSVVKADDGEQAQVEQVAEVTAETSNAEQKVAASEDGSEEGSSESGEVEKLEFTKPTINQLKKEKRDQPLSMASRITSTEFEQLFEEVRQLNSGVQMLKNSYSTIIKSLMMLQNRRAKKRKDAKTVPNKVDGKVTFLTTLSTCDPKELRTKSCLEASDKYDIENFLNPGTRDLTFQMLFDEVDELNNRFDLLRPFFDNRGKFLRNFYDNQEELIIERGQFNEFKLWVKKLSSSVDDITRNYNDDLLNIFRLS